MPIGIERLRGEAESLGQVAVFIDGVTDYTRTDTTFHCGEVAARQPRGDQDKAACRALDLRPTE